LELCNYYEATNSLSGTRIELSKQEKPGVPILVILSVLRQFKN